MANRGNPVIPLEDLTQEAHLRFAAKCTGVPFNVLNPLPLALLGSQPPSDLAQYVKAAPLDEQALGSALDKQFHPPLPKEAILVLVRAVISYRCNHMKLSDRVRAALESIGAPAHYSEIFRAYMSLFPEKPCSERAIHATLLRQQKGVVWVGSKGVYALEDWGYQRPDEGLLEETANVVRDMFERTGRPVPCTVVVAEIAKRRRFVRESSVMMALSLNPNLEPCGSSSYVPRARNNEILEMESEELDRILSEFDVDELE
jgi:hypothetical protein